MKTLTITMVAAIAAVLIGSVEADAQECEPMRKNALGTVVAPFCDPYGREIARQRRERHGHRHQVTRHRHISANVRLQQPRVQYIPQAQPTSTARRCTVNNHPGWCD